MPGLTSSDPRRPPRTYDAELLAARDTVPIADPNDVDAMRRTTENHFAGFRRCSDTEVSITDVQVGTSFGSLTLRCYTPQGPLRGGLLWMHGGAFVLGHPDIDDDLCYDFALGHHLLVVSPDYRLAPEHPYPAAEQDCLAAWSWLRAGLAARDFRWRAPSIAGASAGGNLALRTALQVIASGESVDRLVLAYPVVDSELAGVSIARYASAPVFDSQQAHRMWKRYLADGDPRLWPSPLKDENLRQLPLTFIMTAEHDPLRDEGLELVRILLSAGVSVQALHVAGTFHAYDRFAPASSLAAQFRRSVAEFLERPAPVAADW